MSETQNAMSDAEALAAKWQARFERERKARRESERLLEEKSYALYQKTVQLDDLNRQQDAIIQEQTAELKETVAALRRERDYFETMASESPGVIFRARFAEEGGFQFTYVSRRCRDILGVSSSALYERPEQIVQSTEDPRGWRAAVAKGSSEEGSWTYEGVFEFPGRAAQTLRWICRTDQRDEGLIVHGLILDVSENVETARRMRMLSAAVSRTSNGVLITDRSLRTVWVNESFEKISGYSLDELLGKSPGSILQGERTDPKTRNYMRERIVARESFEVEILNYSKTGVPYWVSVSASPIFDAEGALEYFIAVQTDITAQKHTQERLEYSEQRFRDIVDAAGEYVWEMDSGGRFSYLSKRAEKVLGRPRRDVVGQRPEAFVPVESRRGLVRRMELLYRRPRVFRNWDHPTVRGDGAQFWQRITGVPVWQEDGSLAGFRGTALDVTSERETKEALVAERDFARTVMNSMGQGLTVTDRDGALVFANERFLDLVACPFESLKGRPIVEWIAPDDRERFLEGRKRLKENTSHSLELRLKRCNGDLVEVMLTSVPLFEKGEFKGAIKVVTDLRRRLAMERSLREEKDRSDELAHAAEAANRAKSQFLASMSHEIRTPLNGILGYAQILMKSEHLGAFERSRLKIVQRSGEHLLTIINDLLDLSKIEAGRFETSRRSFDLIELVDGVLSMLEVRAVEKGLLLRSEVWMGERLLPTGTRITCQSDDKVLRQILINLVGNAIKFTPSGSVELRVRIDPGAERHATVDFRVVDSGIGIPERELSRLFDAFHQVESHRDIGQGTGLGLAICQRLAGLLGSRLTVESTEGEGSTFQFAIEAPVESTEEVSPLSAPSRETHERTIVGYRGPRRRILLVDDVPDNRTLLRDLLHPLGFLISEADSGRTALERLAEEPMALVLTDIVMPGMDGEALARAMRLEPRWHSLPVVAVSASFTFDQEAALARRQTFHAYLSKPIETDRLLAVVGAQLGLEWIFAASGVESSSASAHSDGPAVPPLAQLKALYEAAVLGDVAALRSQLESIAEDFPTFAQPLQTLAEQFRTDQLSRELEVFLNLSR